MFFVWSPAQNETPSIERLIEQYSREIMRLCYLYLKDYQLAEEAAQDTLYKAYVKYAGFQQQSSEKTWIIRIAVNVCLDYLRSCKKREYVSDECVRLSLEREASEYTDHESVDLLNAVYNLPAEYKEVILLRYYEQYSVQEIAALLRKKPNTISVRLKRAKEMLKTRLEVN